MHCWAISPRDVDRLGKFREQGRHFGWRFDVVGRVLHAEAIVILEIGTGLDANVDILVLVVCRAHVVGIVGHEEWDAGFVMEADQPLVDSG